MAKRKNKIIFYVVIFLFLLSLLFFIYSLVLEKEVILERKEIFTKLVIGDVAGFDVDSTILSFGELIFLTSATRNILISNNYPFPILAEFSVEGEISELIAYTPSVGLEVGEIKNVTVSTVAIPEGTVFGNYTGTFIITFKKDLTQ